MSGRYLRGVRERSLENIRKTIDLRDNKRARHDRFRKSPSPKRPIHHTYKNHSTRHQASTFRRNKSSSPRRDFSRKKRNFNETQFYPKKIDTKYNWSDRNRNKSRNTQYQDLRKTIGSNSSRPSNFGQKNHAKLAQKKIKTGIFLKKGVI